MWQQAAVPSGSSGCQCSVITEEREERETEGISDESHGRAG